ncbi:hypothetical protein ABZP36_022849 [Zizania latifolia]
MSPAPRDTEDESFRKSRRSERWSWESVPSSLPFDDDEFIAGHAVHPDGRTIFVSVHNRRHDDDADRKKSTYSFNTVRSVWTWHGEWMLPFHGGATTTTSWTPGRMGRAPRHEGYLAPATLHLGVKQSRGWIQRFSRSGCFAKIVRVVSSSPVLRSHTWVIVTNEFCLVESAARQGMDKAHAHALDACFMSS